MQRFSGREPVEGVTPSVYFRSCFVYLSFSLLVLVFIGPFYELGVVCQLFLFGVAVVNQNRNAGQSEARVRRMMRKEREVVELSSVGCHDSGSDVSEDSEPEVDETDDVAHVRQRRDVRSVNFPSTSGCGPTGSPPASPNKNSRPKWLPPGYKVPLHEGNPVFGFRMQLYCRTGYLLGIFSDQKVRGIDEDHPNALVEFSSVDFGEVRIKGLQANLFLAMNKKGRLYGEANAKDEATVFVEYVYGQYNLYLSRKWAHLGWYVGIKKSGKIKPGHQTRYGQKAIQFLPRRKRYW